MEEEGQPIGSFSDLYLNGWPSPTGNIQGSIASWSEVGNKQQNNMTLLLT
jgi:hypothetical protein